MVMHVLLALTTLVIHERVAEAVERRAAGEGAAVVERAAPTGVGEVCQPWAPRTEPAFEGFFMAADPTVIEFAGLYHLYFTAYLPEPFERSVIAHAVSDDGVEWRWARETTEAQPVAVALDARAGEWDAWLETAFVMRRGDELWMFYTGYQPDPSRFVSPYEVGLARSTDGFDWERVSLEPVHGLSASGADNGAMTSPAVVVHEGVLHMVYLGWQLDETGGFVTFSINGATSVDGLAWTRRAGPVLSIPEGGLGWVDAAVEPSLRKLSNGRFYLFITGDDESNAQSPSSIGVLEASHPFGPWSLCGSPAVTMSQPWHDEEIIAPDVYEDDGVLRMYYHGLTFNDPATGERFRVGYAELPFRPLDLDGDGRVNAADVYAFEASPVDINGDGAADDGDRRVLLAGVREAELEDVGRSGRAPR